MANKVERIVTEADIIDCPITHFGARYNPITHRQVIETIDEYLDKNNFRVTDKKYLAASAGQQVIGKVFINYPDAEMGFSMFWKNSLDGHMSFGICAGANTFICSNGSVYGDIMAFKRRHVGKTNNDIISQIEMACSQMEESMAIQIRRKDQMKERDITKRTTAEICGRLFLEEGIITSTQLGIIKGQIENPSYNYKAPGTAWELYSHATHAIKEAAPMQWHKAHKNLGDFFVNEFGLMEPSQSISYFPALQEFVEDDLALTLSRN